MSPSNQSRTQDYNKDGTDWQTQLAKELRASPTEESLQLQSSSARSNDKKLRLAAGGIFAGVSVLVGLQFPFLFPKSAPYMATPGPKIRHALKFLNETRNSRHPKRLSKEQEPPVFVDLGSGDGQAVYEAARLGYRAIGIEFNWTLWAISSIRRLFFWTPRQKALSSFLRSDFHSYNLRDADTIMIFAIPKTMPILGTKIQTECRPGTEILAYRFGIPLALDGEDESGDVNTEDESTTPDAMERVRLSADLIYERGDMRIYQMKENE